MPKRELKWPMTVTEILLVVVVLPAIVFPGSLLVLWVAMQTWVTLIFLLLSLLAVFGASSFWLAKRMVVRGREPGTPEQMIILTTLFVLGQLAVGAIILLAGCALVLDSALEGTS